MENVANLPPQQLSYKQKTKAWRKKHLDWADSKTFLNSDIIRKSNKHKKINQDLLMGKLHMSDLDLILNPGNSENEIIPEKIQHYPIMNSKLNVLKGEEGDRVFDYRVTITNPNAISERENTKKDLILKELKQLMQDTSASEEEFNQKLEKINDYYSYEWQDMREIRANALLTHYSKEYNFKNIFNTGFTNAMAFGEEIYHCNIVGGEPVLELVNPFKLTAFQSGYSNKIEDSDIIILEDYWSPGKIIDTYYESLTASDIKHLQSIEMKGPVDSMDNIDPRYGFVNANMIDDTFESGMYFDPANLFPTDIENNSLPYDASGNIKVLRMYWKSRRKIKKVKSYNQETGETEYNFYPEDFIVNKSLGEEEQIFYINEAWEGTKIADLYINMRPRVIQYNRLSNPSRCHFGIIGSLYNMNDSRPYSLVDMMKPYNYLYDVIHDRLNKAIATNWGSIMELDLAQVPKGWSVEKWMYYAKVNKIAIKDSFKEGDIGPSTGRLAGSMANNTRGILNTNDGNYIQQLINLLEFIKMEMSEVAGITRQREGQTSSRETVGGIERATLQSSHITEWLFTTHDDVKKRVLECFLETAKIAMKGRSKKFPYILSDNSLRMIDIDGDEFSEADYGLVVDNSNGMQELKSKIDTLAQAALQNQTLSFSTIMNLYNSSALSEKQRLIEKDEQAIQERQTQAQQRDIEARQQEAQMNMQQKQFELEVNEAQNVRDNQTKILIAAMQKGANEEAEDYSNEEYTEKDKVELKEKIRQFDSKLKLDTDKFKSDKELKNKELELKRRALNNKPKNNK